MESVSFREGKGIRASGRRPQGHPQVSPGSPEERAPYQGVWDPGETNTLIAWLPRIPLGGASATWLRLRSLRTETFLRAVAERKCRRGGLTAPLVRVCGPVILPPGEEGLAGMSVCLQLVSLFLTRIIGADRTASAGWTSHERLR